MKTDLEKFQELYASLGIELKVSKVRDSSLFWFQRVTLVAEESADEAETSSDKFDGYHGFKSTINFDENGKFLKQGFWE